MSGQAFPLGRLRTAVRHIDQGWSPSCENRTAEENEWGVLKVGCVNGGEFNANEQKALPLGESPIPDLEVREGDILMSRANTRELVGSLALVPATRRRLLVCDKLFRLKLKPEALEPHFLVFAFQSSDLRQQLEGAANGASSSMQNIGQDTVRNLLLPLPTLIVQKAVVRFLTTRTGAIDALIAKKERLIELLQEKRQALITQAVTKGLDPSVPMKDSGVEWLGMIPQYWTVQALRHKLRRIEQGWSPSCESREADDGEWGVLKVGCVNYGHFTATENKALPSDLKSIPDLEVREGDVLVSRANTRELVGSAAYVAHCRRRLLLCDKLFRLHYRADAADPRFLVLLLQSAVCRIQFERDATGASSSMQNIGQDSVRGLLCAWPPVKEQRKIIATVARGTSSLDTLNARLAAHIEKLREYRQALITAAVTGKIDVSREAA